MKWYIEDIGVHANILKTEDDALAAHPIDSGDAGITGGGPHDVHLAAGFL